MKPQTGNVLGDRYQLARQIAVGGMGEVWAADDLAENRVVAVKVLRVEYTGQEDFLARLRVEAKNASKLSHPNIAQVYDYGEQDGTGYIVMELVDGEPLADLLEREPVLPPRRLLPILSGAARGLHAAHQAGVVHRDVKPGNILLEPGRAGGHPIAKVTDFGVSLAHNQAPMTATGMVMGTAQYLSPEQAIGQAATPLSDVYALGVIAYEATAGRRPFTGNNPVDIAVAHVNAPVPQLPSAVHPALGELIDRLLDKEPVGRPASAGALADELDALAIEIARDPLGTAASGASSGPTTTSTSPPSSSPPVRTSVLAPRHAAAPQPTKPLVVSTRGNGAPAGVVSRPSTTTRAEARDGSPALERPRKSLTSEARSTRPILLRRDVQRTQPVTRRPTPQQLRARWTAVLLGIALVTALTFGAVRACFSSDSGTMPNSDSSALALEPRE